MLDGLNLTHDGASVRRAAFEASGFVVRQLIEMSGARASRIVATGGGTRVAPWMQAIADATGLPVQRVGRRRRGGAGRGVSRPDGGRARIVGRDAARWASVERIVEPDPAWTDAVGDRYGRFLELAKGVRHDVEHLRGRVDGLDDRCGCATSPHRCAGTAKSLGWKPVHVGSDGPDHPIAVYSIAGAVVSLWQLPAGPVARADWTTTRNSYVVRGRERRTRGRCGAPWSIAASMSARSGAAPTTSSSGSTTSTTTASSSAAR